ncbi:MAG TPA: hypothetical protein VJ208_03830 [Candidatus Nanoarchaeia archaeon]|nr:hypothetical protein [Candidatus Nanoarchaeia archaeon]
MDCCRDGDKKEECCNENKNQGGKMKILGFEMETKKAVLWGAIGLLLLMVIYTTFFKGSVDLGSLGSNAGSAASAYSGMVGGC